MIQFIQDRVNEAILEKNRVIDNLVKAEDYIVELEGKLERAGVGVRDMGVEM